MALLTIKLRNIAETKEAVPDPTGIHFLFTRFSTWFLVPFGLFIFVQYQVQSLKVEAANDAYTYFRQAKSICRPYMTESQAQMFDARFAAVRSRDEYIEIKGDLERLAKGNNLRLPDFTPW